MKVRKRYKLENAQSQSLRVKRIWSGPIGTMVILALLISAVGLPDGAVAAQSSITSSLTADPASITCLTSTAISFSITNNDATAISDLVIDAFLPTNFSFVGATASQGSGVFDLTTSELTYNFGTLPSQSTTSIAITMTHDDGVGGRYSLAGNNSIAWKDSENVDHTSSFTDSTVLVTGCPDSTPPVTTASAVSADSTPYNFGDWTNQAVSVTLDGLDEEWGSGVANTFYTLDAGSQQTYAAPVVISSEGDHIITFYSVDNSNNAETSQTVHVKIDLTDPTVNYSGNLGTYSVDQTINITCAATDTLSGVSSTTCENIAGPAYSFPLGLNTFNASASDMAGNVGTATTSFTVTDSTASLCALTKQMDSNNFMAAWLCSTLTSINSAPFPPLKAFFVNLYVTQVNLERGLTPDQKSILIGLAQTL